MRLSRGEKVFGLFNNCFLVIFSIVMIIPVWHVAMYSLSSASSVYGGGLFILPRDFSLNAYKIVINSSLVRTSFINTIFVVVVATALNLVMTLLAAYPLSKKHLRGRRFISYYIYFTMLFAGGLIPSYLVIKALGMIDSIWALIIPVACGGYFVFVLRNFITTLPESLPESAKIDGAGEFTIMLRIVVPLCIPALAVIGLMNAVGHWNSWFACIIYINDTNKYTLQPVLRQILFVSQSVDFFKGDSRIGTGQMSQVVKMATVMVATVPILLIYPFIQKYFVKGVMLGAVKG